MKIVPLLPAHIDELHGLYLAVVAPAPHCVFKPGRAIFKAGLERAAEDGMALLAAVSGGRAHGMAAITRLRPGEDGERRDAITALFFEDEPTGLSLVKACEQASLQGDAQTLLAFPASHHHSPIPGYNSGWDGLSDRIPAVGRVLVRAEFIPYYRELHFTCDLDRFATNPGRKPADLTLVESADERGRRIVRALADNRAVAVCVFSTLARMSDKRESRDWGYVWGLGVEEEYRRRGIGKYLLLHAMKQLHADGCQGCWLTTGADNWAAQSLYLRLGFEIADSSASFRKEFAR